MSQKRRELKKDNRTATMFKIAARKEKKALKKGFFNVFKMENWLIGQMNN